MNIKKFKKIVWNVFFASANLNILFSIIGMLLWTYDVNTNIIISIQRGFIILNVLILVFFLQSLFKKTSRKN